MSVQVRRRREAAAFLSTYVGAQGELLVDTTNNRVQIHDGATPGGWPAARLADIPSSTSPLALTQGGTGASAASASALLVALGSIGRTVVADAAYTALVGDRTVAFTALTAARTLTLPAAAVYPTGTALTILDESGACSTTNAVTIARAGSDTINGASSVAITTAYGYLALESNGASKWTVIDSVVVSGGGGSTSAGALTGTLLASNVIASSLTSVGTLTGGTTGAGFTLGLGVSTLTGTLALANGGTSATTGPQALINLGAVARTAVADAALTATSASRSIAYTSLTSSRTVTLPASSAFPTGTILTIFDEGGQCTSTNTIVIATAGSDYINGAASVAIAQAYGFVALQSSGSGKWTVVGGTVITATVTAPTFSVDFTSIGTLPSQIGFSRTTTATYFNSLGMLTAAAANAPRFDYNPATLAALGLLIEEARTNLFLQSGSPATQTISVTSGTAYTVSFFGTGTLTLSGAGSQTLTGSSSTTKTSYTFTASSTSLTATVSGSVTYPQAEAGSTATSYIPTTSAAVTRAADLVTLAGTALSTLQAASASFVIEWAFGGSLAGSGEVLSANSGAACEFWTGTSYNFYNGSTSLLATLPSGTVQQVQRTAASYSAAGRSFVASGGTVVTDTNAANTTGSMYLGSNQGSGGFIDGHVTKLAIYNTRLADSALQSKSNVGAAF